MINTLLGIKKGMTSAYDSRGRRVGATVLEVEPNFITQIKSNETKDGYEAVQLGLGTKKSVKKPQIGHAKKAGVEKNIRYFKEVRIRNHKDYNKDVSLTDHQLGQEIKVGDIFLPGDRVKVSGITKGKGFQGGVKRHGFAGGPKTHGQSDRHRAPGSIGQTTTPGRVYKGKKMAGHMGVQTASYAGFEVIAVDKKKNLITVKGGVPGYINGLVIIEKQGRIKGYTPPPEPEVEDDEEEPKGPKDTNEPKENQEVTEPAEEVAASNTENSEIASKEKVTEEVKEGKNAG